MFPTNGGCPVDWDKLKPRRFTHAILNESGEIREHEDAWYGNEDQAWAMGNPFNGYWTGWTEFEMEDEEMKEGMHDDEEMKEGMHDKDELKKEAAHEDELKKEAMHDDEMDMQPEPEAEMDMDDADELQLTDEEAQAIIELGEKLKAAMDTEAPDMEPEPMDEPDMGADMGEEDEELMEALAGIEYVPERQEIVEEVARRVAKRLLKAKRANQALQEALSTKK